MTYQDISRLLVLFSNIATVYGLYAQAWKVWRSKSAKDFSWELLIVLLVAELAWLNYGIALMEWPIVSLSIANLPAIIVICVMYRKYTRRVVDGSVEKASKRA